jgi:hypothetical protein
MNAYAEEAYLKGSMRAKSMMCCFSSKGDKMKAETGAPEVELNGTGQQMVPGGTNDSMN